MQVVPSSPFVLVAGAGGFIGGHLTRKLLATGHRVRAIDIKPLEDWFQLHPQAENASLDLASPEGAREAVGGVDEVYNLACDMGGIGFIEGNKALCMLSVLINTNLLIEAQRSRVERYFYTSSACVYNAAKQSDANVTPLRESAAYPASPEDGYGWEKLFSERMCRHFREDFGLQTRVARLHNVYGPNGTFQGGREKAPAAICRKVIEAKYSGKSEIEVWGDGTQTRSFLFIDDCLEGIKRIHTGDYPDPLNLGSDELVSIIQLVDIVQDIAGIKLERRYIHDAPRGVNGRNSDNSLLFEKCRWRPSVRLRAGLEETYSWIHSQMVSDGKLLPSDSEHFKAA